ncbi:ferredoxin [Streptomyces atratus]|uniref:ferredoxin n=1 Tax=Streptomyces atratus TaxID=1893 RepID=UPI0009305429
MPVWSTVDVPRCVASGQCVMLAPDVFDQRDEDGMVEVLDDTPPSELHDAVRESATMCPGAAIRLGESS